MKSIKRNLFYNILLNISMVIFPLITAPYVARVLEPDGVGLLNFSGTYAGYFAGVALLGVPTYGIREVSKVRDNKEKLSLLMSQLLTIAYITTLIVSSFYLLSIALIGQLSENYIIFLISGIGIYLSPFNVSWFFEGLEEFGFITFRALLLKVVSIICLFLFVHEKSDLVLLVIIGISSGVVVNIWNYIKMRKVGVRVKFTTKGLKPHMKPILILFSSSIAISIYTVLDTIMLGFIREYSEVAYYNNAVHISKTIMTAVTSLSIVAVPRVSYYMGQKDFSKINQLINKSFSFVSFIAFPVAIGLLCISSVFIPLFYGEKFVGAIIPLEILSLLIIAIGLNNLTGIQVLIGMGLDKLFLYSVLSGSIVNFFLNSLLISKFGAIGASLSSVVAEFLILGVTGYYVYTRTPIRFDCKGDVLKSVLGSSLFLPLFFLLNMVLSGWILVGAFIITGSIVYLLIEYVIGNKSMYVFCNTIINIINRK